MSRIWPYLDRSSLHIGFAFDKGFNPLTIILFAGILAGGLLYVAYSLYQDIDAANVPVTTWLPFLMLCRAADRARLRVRQRLPRYRQRRRDRHLHPLAAANVAVVWSGFFNFLGVLRSTGAVAFGIISLLPVELILQVGSGAGFAMVFALLIAAIIWNLGTWWLGLPASSSHTLIGSIIGVGVANALMPGRNGTRGVDWAQGDEDRLCAAGLAARRLRPAARAAAVARKTSSRSPELYEAPEGQHAAAAVDPRPAVLTCTGVSFAHGSNDGQKGMGLIMLILIGTVPTAYALNRAMPPSADRAFVELGGGRRRSIERQGAGLQRHRRSARRRDELRRAAPDQRRHLSASLRAAGARHRRAGERLWLARQGARASIAATVRNDMYLVSRGDPLPAEGQGKPTSAKDDVATLKAYKGSLDKATKFIPTWVKIAVAIALGLGTMIGWKRIVVTVGEKIGKTHLTYGQGAAAELVADGHDLRRRHYRPAGVAPPTSCRRASPARWRRMARACRWRRCATSRWPGC